MKSDSGIAMFISQAMALFFDVGATFGLLLVIYGSIKLTYNAPWIFLDNVIRWASPIATIIASVFVVISIYIPPNPTPPKALSKYFTAPIVLLMLSIATFKMILTNTPLDDSILLGFSIATMFGSLMRLVPRIHENYENPRY